MCRSIILVSKITHQMLHDHPFSQRNSATKRAVGLEVGGNGEEGVGQNLEKRGRQYRRGLFKIGGLKTLCQLCLCWNYLKFIECYSISTVIFRILIWFKQIFDFRTTLSPSCNRRRNPRKYIHNRVKILSELIYFPFCLN